MGEVMHDLTYKKQKNHDACQSRTPRLNLATRITDVKPKEKVAAQGWSRTSISATYPCAHAPAGHRGFGTVHGCVP